MRVPWCASSNKDRTKWTWYQCPASTDVPALIYFYAVGLYVNDSCDFYGRSLYSYCCWFICQCLLWFIRTWHGAKPRTPTNQLTNYLMVLFPGSACFRIQFLPDHIMIHSNLVWLPWWLQQGAMDPLEGTSFAGLMSTDLTSEFTHFNLVIRLSNVKQSALRFFSLFQSPAAPVVPWETLETYFFSGMLCRTSETSDFAAISQWQSTMSWQRNQAGTRLAGVVFFSFGCLVR